MQARKTMMIFGLICLWATLQPTALAAYSMSETCKYYSGGYIADPSNCQGWGYCKNGALYATGTCGKGFRYNSKNQLCDYASNVQCLTNVNDTCSEVISATYVGDPSNCNRYCYCENGVAIQCNSCPAGQVFNPNTPACDYPSSYQCPAESVCRLVANNQFVGDPDNCGGYLRCVSGSGVSGVCSNNQYFNPLSGYCEATNPCAPGSGNAGTPAPDAALCSTSYGQVAGVAGSVQYFTDPDSCYGYYACSSTNGLGTWLACPFGLQFSQVAQKCVSPCEVSCTKDRCANINAQFMTVPGTQCKSYVICSNGAASAGSQTCAPTGFDYYDEVNGGCVKNKPNYPICAA